MRDSSGNRSEPVYGVRELVASPLVDARSVSGGREKVFRSTTGALLIRAIGGTQPGSS